MVRMCPVIVWLRNSSMDASVVLFAGAGGAHHQDRPRFRGSWCPAGRQPEAEASDGMCAGCAGNAGNRATLAKADSRSCPRRDRHRVEFARVVEFGRLAGMTSESRWRG